MNDHHGVVVVGASLAAVRFAEAARRAGYAGALAVVGEEPHLPYNRPPLSKAALEKGIDHEALAFPLRASIADVQWTTGTRIVSVDVGQRIVIAADGGRTPYSTLVAATGLRPRRTLRDPDGGDRVHAVRTFEDARGLRAQLSPGRRVIVVGGGFVGCEVAATARTMGCEVVLICADKLPLRRQLHADLASRMLAEHLDRGVRVMVSRTVRKVSSDSDGALEVRLSTAQTLAADVIVEATGSAFCTEWLEGSGIDIERGVLTDNGMRALRRDRSIVQNVFAIGDVARFPNPRFDTHPRAVGHWNLPAETAKRAAQVVAAVDNGALDLADLGQFAPVPSFWSDQYDTHLFAYGLIELATSSRLSHGSFDGNCVVEYYRGDDLVAVCGVGMRSTVMSYREQVGRSEIVGTAQETINERRSDV